MIDLTKLDPTEAERLAHAEGFTGVATLYARLSDAEHLNSTQSDRIENMKQTDILIQKLYKEARLSIAKKQKQD
jgi:hypothetical protein